MSAAVGLAVPVTFWISLIGGREQTNSSSDVRNSSESRCCRPLVSRYVVGRMNAARRGQHVRKALMVTCNAAFGE